MELSHNNTFQILGGPDAGLYRVVLDEILMGKMAIVRLDPPGNERGSKGGRKRLATTRSPRKKPPPPLLGEILWRDRDELLSLKVGEEINLVEIEPRNYILSKADTEAYEFRKRMMAPFLKFDHFREMILNHKGIAGLVKEVVSLGASESFARKNFSQLCRLGFDESSLQPTRSLNCGAPGISRPCDPGGRKKPGRKSNKQRIASASGLFLESEQPGMSSFWRSSIIAAYKRIGTPKPCMPELVRQITGSAFIQRYRDENGALVPISPKLGEYPNARQIRRVIEKEFTKLQRIQDRTTKGHFQRSKRGLVGKSWQGVSGPGHTWQIDSTIADVYLRSSINRAWIIGRPVVYIVVDVWSTAIVGFYICIGGPSWDMAKVALFCSVADSQLLGNLWGFEATSSLFPSPTMCAALLCDRGEYLSKAAKITGAKLILNLSYAPPYRPDLKGLVEVMHRIKKDRQYLFLPGAIDQRRKEYDLRRFNPNAAVMTISEYAAFLHVTFTSYNLTAPRDDRLDTSMWAAGVFPTPAGLWRYGHDVGIGVRRHFSETKLIRELLPVEQAKVTRQGVKLMGMEYSSPEIEAREWTAIARNSGGWNIPAHYFPGSVSRLWTPDSNASGLLELQLSDHSTASPWATVQEVLDAFMVGKLNRLEREHIKLVTALEQRQKLAAMIKLSQELTAEALGKATGKAPTMSEARALEGTCVLAPSAQSELTAGAEDPIQMAYLEMMGSTIAAMNDQG